MKITFQKLNWSNTLLLTLLIILLFYVILRAYILSFVHDESLSFQIVLGDTSLRETANNHLLNTFLMSFFYKLFGNSELSLRLPNIIGFIIYAASSFAILKNKNIFIALTGFVLLLLNPYLFDFFSLARGYGLAMGLLMASLYFFIQAYNTIAKGNFLKYAFLSLFFSILATLANFTFISFYFISLFIFLIEFFILIKKKKLEWQRKHSIYVGIMIVVNIVCIYTIVSMLIELKKAGELYFGGYHNNFIDETLMTLIYGSIYKSYYGEIAALLLRQLIISVFVLTLLYQSIKEYDILFRITIVLFLMISGCIIEYYLFDTPYPSRRTALVYIPLFGIYLLLAIEKLLSFIKKRVLFYIISVIIFIAIGTPITYNFIKNINFNYTYEWSYDVNTKQVVQKIKEVYEKKSAKDRKIAISNNWVFQPSINHYRTIYSMDYMLEATRDNINTDADFIYLLETDLTYDIKKLYTVVITFKDTRSILLKRKVNNFEKNEISIKQIQLETADNKYVCVDKSTHCNIYVNDKPNESSVFSLICYANNECAICSYNKQYFCAELGLYNRVTATRSKISAWETFTIIPLDSNFVAFKAVNDKYLSINKKTSRLYLYAKADSIGIDEKFKIVEKKGK